MHSKLYGLCFPNCNCVDPINAPASPPFYYNKAYGARGLLIFSLEEVKCLRGVGGIRAGPGSLELYAVLRLIYPGNHSEYGVERRKLEREDTKRRGDA